MSKTEINAALWNIQRESMKKYGCDTAEKDMMPLVWYINTGRASIQFLQDLIDAKPLLIARDLHAGGSYEDTINRICKRIKYDRHM